MSKMIIDIVADPTIEDRNAIRKPLIAYNERHAGGEDKHLALLIRNDAHEVQGGLWGECYWGWLFVGLFVVPAELRGQGLGASLLRQAEEWARKEGCIGVWLDTFSFQAPGFYEKQGYTVFGTLEHYPDPHRRFFMQKRLDIGG